MMLSRLPLALLIALSPAPASAGQAVAEPPLTAEGAIAHYREAFKPTRELDCPNSANPEEIVVCGRPRDAPDPDRAPLPIARAPGERIPGELLTDGGGCISRCAQPVMVDVVKAAKFMKTLADRLLHGE